MAVKKNIIVSGCCLGDSWMSYFQQPEYADHKYFKFQGAAGSNNVSLMGLMNYNLEYMKYLPDTTVYCQLTGLTRKDVVVVDPRDRIRTELISEEDDDGANGQRGNFRVKNVITGREEINLSRTHPNASLIDFGSWKPNPTSEWYTTDYVTTNLIAMLCLMAQAGADVRVFRGWQEAIDIVSWDRAKKFFDAAGVKYTDTGYLDMCRSFSKAQNDFSEWKDEDHPLVVVGHRIFGAIHEKFENNS